MSIRIWIESISSHTTRLHAVTLPASACAVCDCWFYFMVHEKSCGKIWTTKKYCRRPLVYLTPCVRCAKALPLTRQLRLWLSGSPVCSGRVLSSVLVRLPTLPPFPDVLLAAIVFSMLVLIACRPLSAVIAGGLYKVADLLRVSSWGTAPCTANTVNQCRPLYQQMSHGRTAGDKQTVPATHKTTSKESWHCLNTVL